MTNAMVKVILDTIGMMINNNESKESLLCYIQDTIKSIYHHDIVNNLKQCNKCNLSQGNKVSGEGYIHAEVMLIGEAPGEQEDRLERPFVGPAGQLLDRIITAAGWNRDEIYITNVVKCRPHEDGKNMQPNTEQIAMCIGHLKAEIDLIKPKVIICLGSVAANALIHPKFKITEEHGRWFEISEGTKAMAIYHPSYILHKGEGTEEQEQVKEEVWEDIQKVTQYLEEIRQ